MQHCRHHIYSNLPALHRASKTPCTAVACRNISQQNLLSKSLVITRLAGLCEKKHDASARIAKPLLSREVALW
jgi:hypothetical protein